MNAYLHAEISVKKRGGTIEDYLPLHDFMDSTKELCSDNSHRILHPRKSTMKYLPTESITYKTKLKEDEVLKRLSELVEPVKTFRFGVLGSRSTKPYEGQITGATFDIRRIINYRNSFLPKITGVIEKDYDGINIKVKMKLHMAVIVFLWFLGGSVGMACIAILTNAIRNTEVNPAVLVPFGILFFIYGLTLGAFKFESNISKKDLQKVFEADIMEGFSDAP